MNLKKLSLFAISSLVALNLNVVVSSQAHAAVCSKTDVNFNMDWINAYKEKNDNGERDIGKLFNLAEQASKKSKSSKMRAAWKSLLRGMDSNPDSSTWLYKTSPVGKQLVIMIGYVSYERC